MDSIARANVMEERLLEAMGAEYLLEAVLKAMSVDAKLDVFEYIARNYEVPMEDEEEWED